MAVSWIVNIRVQTRNESYTLKLLNTQASDLLKSLNLATSSTAKQPHIEQLRVNYDALSTHITNYTKESEISIFQDKLTHLLDRHAYIEHLAKQLRIAERQKYRCALLFID